MGCDIHMYVEKKIDGKWVPAQGFVKDKDGSVDVPYPDKIYTGRNYDLFGFLAGVRHKDLQHFPVKGFPDDASTEVRKVYEGWDSDAHTPSWLTLAELKLVNWTGDAMIEQSGIMPDEQWEKFSATIKAGKPDYALIETYWQGGGDSETSSYHEWQYPLKLEFKAFYDEVVNQLQNYDWSCDANEIRVVFWFDN